ncbi:MAG: ABC transporter ATP-binding protein, partial [Chloroflexota bacterium]|nr:ABC transporter ATP-binding protein [Chloroflexota bacterium]
TELSGGQQQRVALARALVTRSKLILYDEPLSNLDTGLRGIVRNQIAELHKAFHTTSIYVTHDQSEALSMADRVLVMNEGRIEEEGTPRDIYARPTSNFVAGFVGVMNIAAATPLDVALDHGHALVQLNEHPTVRLVMDRASRLPARPGETGHIFFRPEAVRLCAASELQPAPNRFAASVNRAMFVGREIECEISLDGWLVRAVLPGDAEVGPGDELTISVDEAKLVWLPASLPAC